MSDWHQIVFNIAHMSYAQGGRGSADAGPLCR